MTREDQNAAKHLEWKYCLNRVRKLELLLNLNVCAVGAMASQNQIAAYMKLMNINAIARFGLSAYSGPFLGDGLLEEFVKQVTGDSYYNHSYFNPLRTSMY